MAIFLAKAQWGRAQVRLPKSVRIAKAKKGRRVVRAGEAALAGLDGAGVLKAAKRKCEQEKRR